MFCHWTILDSVIVYIASIQMSMKLRILLILKSMLLTYTFTFTLKSTTEEDLKTKLYNKRDDFTFAIVTFPFISSNIPASPAYGVYISQLPRYFRACAPYIFVFLKGHRSWRKSYSNKATLLLSHRYKNYTVVITIWLTVKKYPYLKWQWIYYFIRRCFLSSLTARTFTGTGWISEEHGGYVRPWYFGGVRVAHLFSFLCFPIMRLYFLSSVLWRPLRFPHKHDVRFVFTSSPVVYWGFVSYYHYFCWFAQTGVQHILYCVFLRLVYPMLPVFLDCLFLSAPLIFSNVYLRWRLLHFR